MPPGVSSPRCSPAQYGGRTAGDPFDLNAHSFSGRRRLRQRPRRSHQQDQADDDRRPGEHTADGLQPGGRRPRGDRRRRSRGHPHREVGGSTADSVMQSGPAHLGVHQHHVSGHGQAYDQHAGPAVHRLPEPGAGGHPADGDTGPWTAVTGPPSTATRREPIVAAEVVGGFGASLVPEPGDARVGDQADVAGEEVAVGAVREVVVVEPAVEFQSLHREVCQDQLVETGAASGRRPRGRRSARTRPRRRRRGCGSHSAPPRA